MGLWKKLFGKRNREKAELLVQEGFVLAKKGKLTPALECYRKAAEADDTYALAWLNQALAMQDMYNARARILEPEERTERLLEIAEALERALELDDTLLSGWRCLGHVSRRLTRYARAEEAFEKLLELAPEDFEHRREAERELRAVAEKAARQRALARLEDIAADPDIDEEGLKEALASIDPYLDERGCPKGDDAGGAEPEDETLDTDTERIAVGAVPPSVRWALAVILRRLDRVDDARAVLEALLEDAPTHLGALRDLATLELARGDVKAALEHSLAAYREDPLNPALVCNVGVCHLTLGDLGQAREFLKMAVDLAPKDPIVQRAWAAYQEKAPAA